MRVFFETLLVLAVIILAGCCWSERNKGEGPSDSGKLAAEYESVRGELQKLAESVGADPEKCAIASVLDLVSDIQIKLLDKRSFEEMGLTEADWKNIEDGLEVWPELRERIKEIEEAAKFTGGRTVIRLPENEQ